MRALLLPAALALVAGCGQAPVEVEPGELSEAAYRSVVLGVDPEALAERLAPVEPVEVDVRELDPRPSPPTVDSTCVYYGAESGPDGALYRFCFEDDRLVDKAVVRTAADG